MTDPTTLIESAVKLLEETLKYFLTSDTQETTNNEKPSDS